jgi:hypothetical protein
VTIDRSILPIALNGLIFLGTSVTILIVSLWLCLPTAKKLRSAWDRCRSRGNWIKQKIQLMQTTTRLVVQTTERTLGFLKALAWYIVPVISVIILGMRKLVACLKNILQQRQTVQKHQVFEQQVQKRDIVLKQEVEIEVDVDNEE